MTNEALHILLVEDNAADVALLEHALRQVRKVNFKLTHVARLGAMADRLREHRFDVLLLDLSLPDSWGMETVARAHAQAPDIPIIVFTSVDDEATGVQAVGNGAQDYLVKGEADGWQLVRSIRYAVERKRNQTELQKAYDEMDMRVQERTAQLRSAAAALSSAEQRERRRLADYLHDHLQQLLAGAKLNLEALRDRLGDPPLREAADAVCDLLSQSIEESRSMAAELSPPVLYDAGLAAALQWLAAQMKDRYALSVRVEADEEIPSDPEGVCIVLFQAARELLFNVVKHAKVNEALVRVGGDADMGIWVEVSDRGAGFDPAAIQGQKHSAGGFGLFSIRQRLDLVGGKFEVTSAPGQGSRFTLTAPPRGGKE